MTLPSLTLPSPLHRLDATSSRLRRDVWVKRDDLIPELLGGNKARKNVAILRAALAPEGAVPNVLITNGGVQSNHARVVALLGARLGVKVHLVLHGSPGTYRAGNSNLSVAHMAGADTHFVSPDAIAETIANLTESAAARGERALVVPGGGHSEEGAAAYEAAVDELPFAPACIVVASGTGGTQAGLIRGVRRRGWNTRVIGVSVARDQQRGVSAVRELLRDADDMQVEFRDEFRFGGYGARAPELDRFIEMTVREDAMLLDATYTGKAMYALHQLAASGELGANRDTVVFWCTGGLLNMNIVDVDPDPGPGEEPFPPQRSDAY